MAAEFSTPTGTVSAPPEATDFTQTSEEQKRRQQEAMAITEAAPPPHQDATPPSAPTLASINAHDTSLVLSLLDLLAQVLGGNSTIQPDMIPDVLIAEPSATVESLQAKRRELSTNREALSEALFTQVTTRSQAFTLSTQTPDTLVYDHPGFPGNTDYQITYHLNSATQQWSVVAGKHSDAYILDPQGHGGQQLVTVSPHSGVQSFGPGTRFLVESPRVAPAHPPAPMVAGTAPDINPSPALQQAVAQAPVSQPSTDLVV